MNTLFKEKTFSLKEIVYITLISAIFLVLFFTIALFVPYSKAIKVIIIDIGSYGSLLSVIFIFLKYKKIPFNHFGLDTIKFKWIFVFSLTGVLVLFIGGTLSDLFAKILNLKVTSSFASKELITGNIWLDYFQFKILTGIFIPFVEEIYFRGIIFKYIRQNKTFWTSALLSALIFSLFHFDLASIPFTLLLGLTCAYVYEKTDSLFYTILVHASVNMLSISFFFFAL